MASYAAGSADIYTIEYLESDQYSKAIERTCSPMCGGGEEEAKPLMDDERVPKQLGEGNYPRLVTRTGETNVVHYDKRSRKILTQMGFMFHVLIAMRAWKLVVLFFISYAVAYFTIGGVLYLTHDMTEFHGVDSYWDAVVFTGYTMTTVGFGNQYPEHPESAMMPLAAVVFSLLMDAFWLGVIFARVASPRPLRHTLLLSKTAVLYSEQQQSTPTLSCRVINLRVRYPWVDLTMKMSLCVYDEPNKRMHMQDLQVDGDAVPFLDLPWEMKHQITNDSPMLRFITKEGNFDQERGEIIVELNGQDPITGNCMKKRFSYCANEIITGHCFVKLLSNRQDGSGYGVDLTRFHDVEPQIVRQTDYGSNDGSAMPLVSEDILKQEKDMDLEHAGAQES